MCGIAGIFGVHGEPVDGREIESMCNAIVHRGPDDSGYFVKGNVGLGMRRLSIIDVHNGQQPVWNEDRTVCVVLNGEIYNFRELRQQLIDKGHRFNTATDTEVIVHLYEDYGFECLEHLRGMFAFALWDSRQQTLFAARDRLGIKPLYYGEFRGRLLFASELKALLQLPDIDRELNWSSVSHLFSFLSTPADESIIAGVHKLEPGHFLTIKPGEKPKIRCYWDVEFNTDYDHDEAYFVERLQELLQESVRLCMISDVPVGAFLSGGLDSSTVVALMDRYSTGPVRTFSMGFKEKAYDESSHARQVAEAFATEHHEQILTPDVLGMMDDLAWHLDEPFGDSSALPTFMVSRLASQHVKVVLSGDGGDEIFAGYEKYQVEQRERRYRHIPALLRNMMGAVGGRMGEGMKGRNFLRHIALDGPDRYIDAATMFKPEQKQSLFTGAFAEKVMAGDPWRQMTDCLVHAQSRPNGHWLSALQYLDIKHYLPLDILTKVDRMSMANSIETRVPLLDHKLVEFAATVPPAMRMRGDSSKHLFKQAMRGILPDDIIDRPKQGFGVPLGAWFRGELDSYVRELLLSDKSRSRGIFDTRYIEKLLAMHQRGRPLDLELWTLITFELWCKTFLDETVIGRQAPMEVPASSTYQFPPGQALSVS